MRKVFILPNLFTAASLFCGMLAIFEIINNTTDDPQQATEQACLLILLSALLDVADGAIARLTRSTSAFGLNFDSLSDLVAFGAAPAILAYNAFWDTYPRLAVAVCSLYTICGALRLARFNVQATREEKKSFSGLPIPGAAMAVISVIWVYKNPNLLIAGVLPLAIILPPVLVVIAYLMVSQVPFYGFKSFNLAGRQPFEILVTIVVIACLLYLLKTHLDIVLALVSWTYVIGGAIVGLVKRSRQQTADEQHPLSSH